MGLSEYLLEEENNEYDEQQLDLILRAIGVNRDNVEIKSMARLGRAEAGGRWCGTKTTAYESYTGNKGNER